MHTNVHRFFVLITIFFLATGFTVNHFFKKSKTDVLASVHKQKRVALFDGKTLKGWHTIPGGEWKVENGAIVGRSVKTDERHGLLVTDKKFTDFELSINYKAIQGNSGLYFRVDEVGGVVGVHGFQAEIDPTRTLVVYMKPGAGPG
jgi:hypothetical protein